MTYIFLSKRVVLAIKKGKRFALMKTFRERSPPPHTQINKGSVGKMKTKWSYFLSSGNQVEKCWKGQTSSCGLSVVFLSFINSGLLCRLLFLHKSMGLNDWCVSYAYMLQWQIPTVPWLKTENPPLSPYQTSRLYYYADPKHSAATMNLIFNSFFLHVVN